jgi:T4 RnlA family RNA ligase
MKIFNTHIPSYEEALEIVKSNDTFYETKHKVDEYNVSTFNYRLSTYDDFINPIKGKDVNAKEMRSICYVFNNDGTYKTYLALQKFWNLNQVEETMYGVVKNYDVVEIHDKADGSLCSFIKLPNGKVVGKTQNSFDNEQTEIINDLYKFDDKIQDFIEWCESNNYSAIFEFVSFKNKIVLDYDKSELILLKVRNNTTGEYIEDYDSMGLKTVKKEEILSIDQIVKLTETTTNKEGWVITLKRPDDFYSMIKIKTVWYCDRHNLLTNESNREDYIIKLVLEESIDDLIAQLDPISDKDKINRIKDIISITKDYLNLRMKEVDELVSKYDGNIKDYAIKYKKDKNFSMAISIIRGRIDSFTAVKKFLLKETSHLGKARYFVKNRKLNR